MPVSVTLPSLGESVTEGTVTRWLKAEGDHVRADEPLLEVSTDKVDTEIPAPISGILASIAVAEDETTEVGFRTLRRPPRPVRPRRRMRPPHRLPPSPPPPLQDQCKRTGPYQPAGRPALLWSCRCSARASPKAPSPAG
ncbi:lipoyl domain-containing protein [Actinomadura sp. OS1-43]|uniref:lipoyl domain-containing protein n=1 Tax=Actinomadura sp. OS1-43 TaxID=604315 RepID=UPI00255A9A39|nr:lipoyl domain-containing protein [Actinomadura sp. OS1-43]MDL4818600.1 lipoyl domain-containing protein [Actinomadura sp. OS1-43]